MLSDAPQESQVPLAFMTLLRLQVAPVKDVMDPCGVTKAVLGAIMLPRILLQPARQAQHPFCCAEFRKHPLACLTLASFLATNTGDVARRHIRDPELLSFIDIECFCWSTVLASMTPMINAGMVFCDRSARGRSCVGAGLDGAP